MTTACPTKPRFFCTAVILCGVLGCSVAPIAGETTVTVDLRKPGAAVNPYIYGQFIEHMGRCIHGGIWAEMLHDRKFLLAPGKSWEKTGPEGADFDVAHDTAGAYCGDHGMAVWVRNAKGGRCGIRQGKIGLIEGKEYVGYALLAHAAKPVDVTVRISWGKGKAEGKSIVVRNVAATYKKFPFRFTAGASTNDASLSVTISEPGYLWTGCLSLMPADNVNGMRADTLELLKKLNSPIYRWPGGNFVSGYHWRDGIGPRDRRPPRWERAWKAVEDNDFGIDEFIAFCREIKTEPLVVVNTGLGSAEEAVAQVEYANGSAQSGWGARRAANGRPKPYGVVWWGAGNEMYGGWQMGHVPVKRYAVRHNAFVRAMKTVDPKIKIVAVGAPGKWNNVIAPRCADHMDLLSAHHYTQRRLRVPFSPADAKKYEDNFLNYSGQIAGGVRGLINDLRARQGKGNKAVDGLKLSIDEWGMVRKWENAPDPPGVGIFEVYYPLGDAVAVGRALHELLRAADIVEIAQWSMAVNVVGAIKTSRTHASFGPVGHLLALYRARVGGRLIPMTKGGAAPLDVVAAADDKAKTISVGLINFSPKEKLSVKLNLLGAKPAAATAWRIGGPDIGAINVPGKPEAVTTIKLPEAFSLEKPIVLPAHSITVLQFANRK